MSLQPQIQRSIQYYSAILLTLIATLLIFYCTAAQTMEASVDIPYYIDDIAWSPDGDLIAVLGSDGVVIYTDSLQEVAHFQEDITQFTISLSWSPDSMQLATVGDGSIFIWARDQNDEFTLDETLNLPDSLQVLVAWSPDGSMLASQDLPDQEEIQGAWSQVHIWNTNTWELERTFQQDYRYVEVTFPFALEWNVDSSLLAGTGFDRTAGEVAWIADVTTGQQTYTFPQIEPLSGLTLHSNGQLVVGAGTGMGIYNIITRQLLYSIPAPQVGDVRDLSWSPDGTKLLFRNGDVSQVWDFATGQPIASLPNSYELNWSPDGTRIISGGINPNNNSRTLNIWDVSSLPGVSGTPTITPYPTVISSLTPSPTGLPPV